MEIKIVYNDKKDKEFLDLIDSKVPYFVEYINCNESPKEAYKLKSHWCAIKNPFAIITDEDKIVKVFYSDAKGSNAIQQLINYLNVRSASKET